MEIDFFFSSKEQFLNAWKIYLYDSYIHTLNLLRQYLILKNDLMFYKPSIRFPAIWFIIYHQLWVYYHGLIQKQQFLFSKLQYFKFTQRVTVKKFRIFLYKSSSTFIKKKMFFKTFGYNQYKKYSNSLKYSGLHLSNFKFSWHAISLWCLRFRNINKKFFFSKLQFFRKISIIRPFFINIYNQKFISKYSHFRYSWYEKYDIPFNIFYEHINSVESVDILEFLHKFVGLFTFSGKKQYALKLTVLLRVFAQKFKLNFYQLLRHFLFHYSPFIYPKILISKRRRITKPTLLSKEKAFFFVIKWWKEAAFQRKGNSLAFNLFEELREIFLNKGAVVQKFRQGLVTVYNARSDLKAKSRDLYGERRRSFLWGLRFRKYLNKFIYNTRGRNRIWDRKLLLRRRAASSFIMRKFLLKSSVQLKFSNSKLKPNLLKKKNTNFQKLQEQSYKNLNIMSINRSFE